MPLTPEKYMAAFRNGVLNVFLYFFHGGVIDQGTLKNSGLKAVANFEVPDRSDEFLRKGVIDPSLDVKPVRADAGLTGVAVFGNNRSFNCSIQIGIIENDKGRIPAEFQGKLLHSGGALLNEQAADLR